MVIALSSHYAEAATRKVFFSASALSQTVYGLSSRADKCSCTLTITNASTRDQTYNITDTTITAANTTGAPIVGATTTSGSLTGTLTSGQTATVTWTYGYYKDKPTDGFTAGSATYVCRGTITATDNTANPGFLVANGALITFMESGTIKSTGSTSFSANTYNFTVYTQQPILINAGKPF
jgi:hypothetical protein